MARQRTIPTRVTDSQWIEISDLACVLWPDEKLSDDELCRRLLLMGCDGLRGGLHRPSDPEPPHLLDDRHLPTHYDRRRRSPKR